MSLRRPNQAERAARMALAAAVAVRYATARSTAAEINYLGAGFAASIAAAMGDPPPAGTITPAEFVEQLRAIYVDTGDPLDLAAFERAVGAQLAVEP